MRKKFLVVLLGIGLAIGCIACGGTDSASQTLGSVSEAVDTASTTDTVSQQSEVETSNGGVNSGIEMREYTWDEVEKGMLDDYVPPYIANLDCSTFDPSRMPTALTLVALGMNETKYKLPIELPININELFAMEDMTYEENRYADNEIEFYYKDAHITSEFGFTNSNDDERSLEEYKNDGIFVTSFDYGQIPAITETEGYGDEETFDVLIKSLGVPSGYAVFNFINNDMTQSKSIFLAYEYEEYVLLFNIFDMNYYQYVGDETYRPDQVKSDVSYYTTEAWNKGNLVSELSEPSEGSIRFDLVYSAGTLAK